LTHRLRFTSRAKKKLEDLEETSPATFKQVKKALGYLELNPRHSSLNTHKYSSIHGPNGEETFEAYAQNNTARAYRIFFWYGPDEIEPKTKKRVPVISILSITPHP
jgi:hypothetical protein